MTADRRTSWLGLLLYALAGALTVVAGQLAHDLRSGWPGWVLGAITAGVVGGVLFPLADRVSSGRGSRR